MKKTSGYPLCTIVLISLILFESLSLVEDFQDKMPLNESQTLAELSEEEQSEEPVTPETSEEVSTEEGTEPTITFTNVDDSYFDDAAFIGDSRIVGMQEYSGLENATFYASVGMNVYDLFEKKFIVQEGTNHKIGLEEALGEREFRKVYIMVGINELGRDTPEGFLAKYAEVVDRIRQLQPNAMIYVQSIIVVTKEYSDREDIFNNTNIGIRNDLLQTLDNGENVFYLNVNEVMTDADGGLCDEYTGDDTHLYAGYYYLWVDYLKSHAIVIQTD